MKNKFTVLILIAFICAVSMSCSGSIKIQANTDSSCDVSVQTDMGRIIYETILSLSEGMNSLSDDAQKPSETVYLFHESDITSSFKNSDFTQLKVTIPSVSAINVRGRLTASSSGKKLNRKGGIWGSDFVSCGKNSLSVILSPDSLKKMAEGLPEDSKNMLDLLMAPVFSGEEMSGEEYVELISLIYGDDMAKEFSGASIKIVLAVPKGKNVAGIESSQGNNVKRSSSSVEFSIPVVELLTLSSEKKYSVSW